MHRPISSLVSLSALSAFSVASSLALAGCGEDPPTPGELRTRIASDLGSVLREANASFTSGSAALPGAAAGAMVDRVLAGSAGGAALDAMLGGRVQSLTTALAARRAGVAPGDPAVDPLVDADAQVAYLNDRLFTDANHLGDGIYRVPAELVCGTADATCAAQLAKIDLRIRTANDGGAVVFAIQVDAAHDEPLRLTLTHTSLAVTVDLDGAQHAFTALAGLVGGDPPNAALAGQVTGKLEILGTAKARASLAIDRALAIAVAGQGVDLTGPDAFALGSAPGEVFAVVLDGAAVSGSLSLGLGATTVKIPDDAGAIALDLPGATALASFARGQPTVVSHLGLGSRSTTLSVGGARGVTIDLNPHDGRALDATLTQDAAGHTTALAVSPRLELQVALDHAVLGDAPPVYDVTRIALDGNLVGDAANQRTAVTGSLSIATSPASYGFTATTGQCVTSAEVTDPATGAPYTRFTVAACP